MRRWPDDYPHNLSSRAVELLRDLNQRIREEIDYIEFPSDAREYVAYKAPRMRTPFAYSDRRDRDLFIHLRIPFGQIEDPRRVCERGTAVPPLVSYDNSGTGGHTQVKIDTPRRIDYAMDLLRQTLQHNQRHN